MEHFAPAAITGIRSNHNVDEDHKQSGKDKDALNHCCPISLSTTRSDIYTGNEIEHDGIDNDKTAEHWSTPLTPLTPVRDLVSQHVAAAAQSPLNSCSVEPPTTTNSDEYNKEYADNIVNIIAEANRRATTQKVTSTNIRWPTKCLQCVLLGLPCDQAHPQCSRCARRLKMIENPPILPPSAGPRNSINFASWAVLGIRCHEEESMALESYNSYLIGPATAGSFASSATEKEVMQSSCVVLRRRDFLEGLYFNETQNKLWALLPPRNRSHYLCDDRYTATLLTRMCIENTAVKKWKCRLDGRALWNAPSANTGQQDTIAAHKEERKLISETIALDGVISLENGTLVRSPERGGTIEEILETTKKATDKRIVNARDYELWEMALELEQKKNDRQNWVTPCRYKTDKGWLGLPSRLKENERGLFR